jgi:hypothetical protein
MSVTDDLINVLNDAERKGFIAYLKDRNKRHDAKNISLFKDLLNKEEAKLKLSLGANTYNVLKKRLTDNLLNYLSNVTVENEATEEIGIIRLLLVGRKLFAHRKYKSGFKILSKAEEQAEVINHYSLLNEIYQTVIENAYLLNDEEHELVFTKFESNRDELVEQGKLNMVYSTVRKAYFKVEKEGEFIDLEDLLQRTYERFNISEERGYNFKSLYQMAQLADLAGASSKNYYSVDTFFESKIADLEGNQLDTEKHLIYHIDLLYLMANIYFRKRLFKQSMLYLEKMAIQMLRFDNRYHKEKYVQYITLLSLNLNFLARFSEAVTLLDDLVDSKEYIFDELAKPLICKMMIHFQQEELGEVRQILSQFSRTDLWYERQLGQEWLLYKNFSEILLHIELGNIDYADSRFSALTRKLTQTKMSEVDPRIKVFLKWIDKYMKDSSIIDSPEFKKLVESSVEWKPREQEDIFMMCFYAWLKSKVEKRNIYYLTLELVALPEI